MAKNQNTARNSTRNLAKLADMASKASDETTATEETTATVTSETTATETTAPETTGKKKIQWNIGVSEELKGILQAECLLHVGPGATKEHPASERELMNAIWQVVKTTRHQPAMNDDGTAKLNDDGTPAMRDLLADEIKREFALRPTAKGKASAPRKLAVEAMTAEDLQAEMARINAQLAKLGITPAMPAPVEA